MLVAIAIFVILLSKINGSQAAQVNPTLTSISTITSISTFSISTPSEEQSYIDQIQPGLRQLDEWIKGPFTEYQNVLNQRLNVDGTIASGEEGAPISIYLDLFWNNGEPGLVILANAIQEKLGPAAEKVSTSGFTVLGVFNGIIPPASMRTAHEQIVSCIKYRVELTSELQKSVYVTPKSLQSKDPCDLLDTAIQVVSQYISDNFKK